MKTCIIIDDEKNAREALAKIIERYFNTKIKILQLADSVKEGVFAINKYRPVSHLSFISRTTENIVVSQLNDYLSERNLHSNHSAEIRQYFLLF